MENGMNTHVPVHITIYVKVIFVSLLFYFVDNIIELKNKPKTKQNKTTQLEQFHNPIIERQNIYILDKQKQTLP
jgi:uncharacterized membrane protein